MSTKNIILCLVGVIIIGGAIYFAMSKKSSDVAITPPPIQTTKDETSLSDGKSVTMEPRKDASNEEIIDYIVDGQARDETQVVEASLEISSASDTSVEIPTINTNF